MGKHHFDSASYAAVALLGFNQLIQKPWGKTRYTPMDGLLWPLERAV